MLEYGYSSEREDKPYIENISITYCQEPDNNQDRDECQYLRLESKDGGGGPYIRMYIPNTGMLDRDKEGFWSVSDISSLFEIFEDFKKKINWIPEGYDKENYKEFYEAPPKSLVEEILYKYINDYGKENVKEGAQYIVDHWRDGTE